MCATYTDQMDTLRFKYTQMKRIHFAMYSGHMSTFVRVTRMNESCKCGMSYTDQMDTLRYKYTQMKCIHFAMYSGHMDTFARVTHNESCKCGMSHV